ncbi:MAG: aldose epimerase family protein [Janthinobacterium lividum]
MTSAFRHSSLRRQVFAAALLLLPSSVSWAASDNAVVLTQQEWGALPDGGPARLFTLRNAHGLTVKFTNYGGIITEIDTPDRTGTIGNIVLGFSSLNGYVVDSAKGGLFFGALVGRYANRLARGQFTLDGRSYQVPVTAPPNSLHGGTRGFDKQVWTVRPQEARTGEAGVELSLVSPDGDQGFPGTLRVHVTYTLTDTNELRLQYRATTDRDTVLNLTNHSYFNLGGNGSGTIEHEVLRIAADRYTPTDSTSIPTGAIDPVVNTPLDFRKPTVIGDRLRSSFPQMVYARGYDQNWIIDGVPGQKPRLAAEVSDPRSGRTMQVLTTQPGLQVYTGNSLDGTYVGSAGTAYRQTDGIAFETQHYPDSPNHPTFPTTELKPGQTFEQTTIYRFGMNPAR